MSAANTSTRPPATSREQRQPDRSSIACQAELLLDEETPSREAMRREATKPFNGRSRSYPQHYREVIRLRNFELLELDEIAAIMQRSPQALRALWLRAIQRLKLELDCHDV